jgi:low temperature requirement protein LtrA
MVARNTEEPHRASTPLELLFDLCFVVAVSQAARELNVSLSRNHFGSGIVGYITVSFAIWWAWVNFTWFASAYDTDDVAYRLLTFVQIVGVLILAAGVPAAFVHSDFTVITIGYVVMRVALVTQWLRAATGDPSGRSAARRYAAAVTAVQIGWIARLFLPHVGGEVAFPLLALAEMLVPAWAERSGRGTSWHPQHISERYGLFTLIVLGECVAAATVAMQSATSSGLSAPAWRPAACSSSSGCGGGTSSIRPRRACGNRGIRRSCGATPTTPSSLASPPWAPGSKSPWRAPGGGVGYRLRRRERRSPSRWRCTSWSPVRCRCG